MDFGGDDSERGTHKEKTSFMAKMRKSSNAQSKETRVSEVSHIATNQNQDDHFEMHDSTRRKFNNSVRDSNNGENLEDSFNDTRESNQSQINKKKNKEKKGIFGGFFSRAKKEKTIKDDDSSQPHIQNTEEDS